MWAYTPLSGEGAKQYGGRFNRPGVAALYTSLDFTTAWLEAQQGFSFKPQPMTLVAYQVDCSDIIDLQDPTLLALSGIQINELACAWEDLATQKQQPPSWVLVDRLRTENFAGMLVRSFAPGCAETNLNLVLWDWSAQQPHAIEVIDDLSRLPRNQDAWR
jgi:RES domain-containing protein